MSDPVAWSSESGAGEPVSRKGAKAQRFLLLHSQPKADQPLAEPYQVQGYRVSGFLLKHAWDGDHRHVSEYGADGVS
jgi:hypothetical protein